MSHNKPTVEFSLGQGQARFDRLLHALTNEHVYFAWFAFDQYLNKIFQSIFSILISVLVYPRRYCEIPLLS